MIGSTFLKLLPTAHLHLRRDLSLETSKNTYPVIVQSCSGLSQFLWDSLQQTHPAPSSTTKSPPLPFQKYRRYKIAHMLRTKTEVAVIPNKCFHQKKTSGISMTTQHRKKKEPRTHGGSPKGYAVNVTLHTLLHISPSQARSSHALYATFQLCQGCSICLHFITELPRKKPDIRCFLRHATQCDFVLVKFLITSSKGCRGGFGVTGMLKGMAIGYS